MDNDKENKAEETELEFYSRLNMVLNDMYAAQSKEPNLIKMSNKVVWIQNELRLKMLQDRIREQRAMFEEWKKQNTLTLIVFCFFLAACVVLSGCGAPITTDAVIVESVIDTGGALETIEVPAVLQVCPPPPPLQRYALSGARDEWRIDQYAAAALTEIEQRAEVEALLRELLLVCGGN